MTSAQQDTAAIVRACFKAYVDKDCAAIELLIAEDSVHQPARQPDRPENLFRALLGRIARPWLQLASRASWSRAILFLSRMRPA